MIRHYPRISSSLCVVLHPGRLVPWLAGFFFGSLELPAPSLLLELSRRTVTSTRQFVSFALSAT